MAIKLSNLNSVFESLGIKSKTTKTSKTEAETEVKSWEFMKKIDGLLTDFLNKQINIPSTAITPALCLTTKGAFSSVFFAFNTLKAIKNKSEQIANIFSKDNDVNKRKEMLKKSLGLTTRRWK